MRSQLEVESRSSNFF